MWYRYIFINVMEGIIMNEKKDTKPNCKPKKLSFTSKSLKKHVLIYLTIYLNSKKKQVLLSIYYKKYRRRGFCTFTLRIFL